jgi:hypothetical protein
MKKIIFSVFALSLLTLANPAFAGVSKKDAKKACLAEKPDLKGKDLQSCIKGKVSAK